MANTVTLADVRKLGNSRAEIAKTIAESEYAPEGRTLSDSALGMWFTRGAVPLMWRQAVMDRLGLIKVVRSSSPSSQAGRGKGSAGDGGAGCDDPHNEAAA